MGLNTAWFREPLLPHRKLASALACRFDRSTGMGGGQSLGSTHEHPCTGFPSPRDVVHLETRYGEQRLGFHHVDHRGRRPHALGPQSSRTRGDRPRRPAIRLCEEWATGQRPSLRAVDTGYVSGERTFFPPTFVCGYPTQIGGQPSIFVETYPAGPWIFWISLSVLALVAGLALVLRYRAQHF